MEVESDRFIFGRVYFVHDNSDAVRRCAIHSTYQGGRLEKDEVIEMNVFFHRRVPEIDHVLTVAILPVVFFCLD